jgi:hypothetical protein
MGYDRIGKYRCEFGYFSLYFLLITFCWNGIFDYLLWKKNDEVRHAYHDEVAFAINNLINFY